MLLLPKLSYLHIKKRRSMPDKLVSIITPAWKAESFIKTTIDSVIQQTHKDWEMIIVDDCSPDNTFSVVEEIAKHDSRIRLIRHEKNSGPATARNTGCSVARGRWVAMLDSDDSWLPDKLEKQLEFHRKKNCVLTYTAYRRVNSDYTQIGDVIRIPDTVTYNELLGNTAIATSTVMMDRTKTGNIHFKKMYYDDFGCWLDLLRNGDKAYGLQEDLMRYRVLSHSVSRNKLRSAHEVWKTYRNIEKLPLLQSLYYFTSYSINALLKYKKF